MKFNELINRTRNQHFISQAEQRLNSCSSYSDSKNAKINCFEILEKNPPEVRLIKKNFIKNNLSFHHLFTLKRFLENKNYNLEKLFGRYEEEIQNRVESLLEFFSIARKECGVNLERIDLNKIKGFKFEELLRDLKYIYKCKLMNGLRNPHRIKETLKEYQCHLDHVFDDEQALEIYLGLEFKNCSESKRICDEFKVSKEEYKQWIRLLLLFLYPQKNGSTILDNYVENLFHEKKFIPIL